MKTRQFKPKENFRVKIEVGASWVPDPEQPAAEQQAEQVPVQMAENLVQEGQPIEAMAPMKVDEPQESIGSASVRPVEFWASTTTRCRVGIQPKYDFVPVMGEEDIQRRFNGNSNNARRYSCLAGNIIPDKGFGVNVQNHPVLDTLRTLHSWTEFLTHHGEDGYVELTREFFCNLNEQNHTSWVRGTEIDLSAAYLNRFLGTPDYPSEFPLGDILKLKRRMRDKPFLQKVAESMTISSPSAVRSTFPASLLKVEFQPTYDFFMSRIRPSSHPHNTSGVVLIGFAKLWAGRRINIGEHLFEVMMKRIGSGQALCYPNLIKRICIDQGVDLSVFDGSHMVPMNPPIPVPDCHFTELLTYELPPPVLAGSDSAQSSRMPPPRQRAPVLAGSDSAQSSRMPPPRQRAPKRARTDAAPPPTEAQNPPVEQNFDSEDEPVEEHPENQPAEPQQPNVPAASQRSHQVSQFPELSHTINELNHSVSQMTASMVEGMNSMMQILREEREEARRKEERRERMEAEEKVERAKKEAEEKAERERKEAMDREERRQERAEVMQLLMAVISHTSGPSSQPTPLPPVAPTLPPAG